MHPNIDTSRMGVFSASLNQERALLTQHILRFASRNPPPPSHIRFGVDVSGDFDVDHIRQSVAAINQRHPALRIKFVPNLLVPPSERERIIQSFMRTGLFTSGVYTQSVVPEVSSSCIVRDLQNLTNAEQQTIVRELVSNEERRSFDHNAATRMRVFLVRTGRAQCRVIFFLDHLVFDGFSGRLFLREFEAGLQAYHPTSLDPPIPIIRSSFPEFCTWQVRACHSGYFASSLSYWRNQWLRFAGARISPRDLPFATPLSTQPNLFLFASQHKTLAVEDSAHLRLFSAKNRTSLFVLFLSAFAVVLHRHCGKTSVALWSHFANRVRAHTANTIGWFSNSHILGIDLSSDPTAVELLKQSHIVVTNASVHQELPLVHLWHRFRSIPRVNAPTVLLDYRKVPRSRELPDKNIRVSWAKLPDSQLPRFAPLGVYVIDDVDEITLTCKYASGLFESGGIRQLLGDVMAVAAQLAQNPKVRVSDCAVVGPTVQRSGGTEMEEFVVFEGTLPLGIMKKPKVD
jgi:hypothetical protein